MAKTLLEWLGFPRREALNRDFAAWLLEHQGSAILAPVLPGLGPLEADSVQKEASTGKGGVGRMDLTFRTDAALVGMEVKVRSGDTPGQLRRYADVLAADPDARPERHLLFITETGLVPECPYRLAARHQNVTVGFGTWDQLVTPELTDPVGWCDGVRARSALANAERVRVEGAGALGRINVQTDWNIHARALRDVARNLVAGVDDPDLGIVHGPVGGAYGNEKQVIIDLAKPSWHLRLGEVPRLAQVNPFLDDNVRVSVRVRLQIPPSGRLQLAIGSGILPYSRGLGAPFAEPVRAFEGAADQLARRLGTALGGRGANAVTQAWRVVKLLAEEPRTPRSRTPRFDNPRLASMVNLVTQAVPTIDAWIQAGGP